MQNYAKCTRNLFKFVYSLNSQHAIRHCHRNFCNFDTNNALASQIDFFGRAKFSTCPKKVQTIEELATYLSGDNKIRLRFISDLINNSSFDQLTEEQAILLLESCGKRVPDATLVKRDEICQKVYQKLLEAKFKFTNSIIQSYLKVCTENRRNVNVKEFIASLEKDPNLETYKLLLKNVSLNGDIGQTFYLLNLMKEKELPVDEEVFNSVIFAHILKGGLKSAEEALKTMRTAKIPITNDTNFAIIKAASSLKNHEEFRAALKDYKIQLNNKQVFELLENVGFYENHVLINEIQEMIANEYFSREFIKEIENICVNFIHMEKVDSAFIVFKTFIEPVPGETYGYVLLREMLVSHTPMEKILEIVKNLKEINLNYYALENITELALRYKHSASAWSFFEHFEQLRPHYFWPLLITSHKKDGELGVLNSLQKITDLKTKLDAESFENYVLPFLNLNEPQKLIIQLQKYGYTVKELLPPVLVVLLRNKNTTLAQKTCSAYNVVIESSSLFEILPQTWITTKNSEACVFLLQKLCESSKDDLVGLFLINILKNKPYYHEFLKLTKLINSRKLTTNSVSADTIITLLEDCKNKTLASKIQDNIDAMLDFEKKHDPISFKHPRDMNIEELECHLLELKSKEMDTRGLLRKLIQKYCNAGNHDRVQELLKEFKEHNYFISPGLKSSLLQSYVQTENLEKALEMYQNIQLENSNFDLDNFKILDLATLLVKNNKFDDAMDLLEQDCKKRNGKIVAMSSKHTTNLLKECKNPKEQLRIFNFLVDNKYIVPANVLLGPLVKIHIESNDLNAAVEIYENLAKTYNCTPLQLEILCATLEKNDDSLIQRVLASTAQVHGTKGANVALISALCELRLTDALRKFFREGKIDPDVDLTNRCNRWVTEDKLDALLTLYEASERMRPVNLDLSSLQFNILEVYSNRNDCEGAIKFYEHISEKNDFLDEKVEKVLHNLLKRNKYHVPESIHFKGTM